MKYPLTPMSQLLVIRGKLEAAAARNRKVFLRCDPHLLLPAIDQYTNQSYWIKSQKVYTKGGRSYTRTVYMCPCCAKETIQPQNYCGNCGASLQLLRK